MIRLCVAVLLMVPTFAMAQGTRTTVPLNSNNSNYQQSGRQGTVQTQPSANPFVNPLGQGVPPAASIERRRQGYGGRTN